MEPVVNGLESALQGEVAVLRVDAEAGAGAQAFRQYAMPGHPSYLLLSADGSELWRAFGPMGADDLQAAVEAQLNAGGG